MDLKSVEGNLTSADGAELFLVKNPADQPKAVIVIVHGLGEHLKRYDYVVARFNDWGYSAYRFDLPGHGRSGGLRGFVEDYEFFLKDTDQVVLLAREENPGKPIFLLGHSMGGFISTAYGVKYPSRLTGLIHSGAAVILLPAVKDLGDLDYNALALTPIPNALSAQISRDPAVVQAYDDDPLVLKEFTMKLMGEVFIRGVGWLVENMEDYRYPCLILHGRDDQLVPAEASTYLFEHISSTDKRLKVYDGLYHEIFNEPEKDQVLEDVHQWIEGHI